MKWIVWLALTPLLWTSADSPPAVAPVEIREWPVPWENSRPRDPYVGPQGRVWFVGQRSDYVAYLVPETGEFRRYELEAGAGPHNLIVDPKGSVWYAGNRAAHIGKLDPKTGEIVKFPTPNPARDPHTLVFDSKGDIWFTNQGGNAVGKLTTATGDVRVIPVPTPNARPYGIGVDKSGRPWIVLLGTNKLATVDPATMQLREITIPRAGTRPRRIAITSDQKIWYVDYAGGALGRYDPATGAFEEWPAPSGERARPYAMAVDDKDRLWFVETGPAPNRLVGFDPKTKEFFSVTEIPSGGGTVRHMVFHAPTRTLWFGTDENTIGRARVP
ncbi:MAG: virginiamycin B lyase family protein [Gemmatimonadota bacterium]